MSRERMGLHWASSWLLVPLTICLGNWVIAQVPQVQAPQGQQPQVQTPQLRAPHVPASVTSYPLQEPVGLQSPETRQASDQSLSATTTTTVEPPAGSISDYYQESSTGEFQVVEGSPIELSSEETVEILEEACEVIDGEEVCLPPSFTEYMLEPYSRYREDEAYTTYMPGDGDQFGWLTFGSNTWLNRGENTGMELNFNLHLLSGPEVVALPPRLYDFELGYQSKTALSETFSYDLGLSVGIYSDFEDSARDGVRFPAHLVGMVHPTENWDWVFGVEYLDRDDIKMLPVIGFVWHDTSLPGLRVEAVFPRPRIDLQIQQNMRLYWTARLGGGSWDIEMPDDSNDVFTYRDYQILMGLESLTANKELRAWEFGFVFSRHIEFRSRPDEVNLDEAFVIRHVTRY